MKSIPLFSQELSWLRFNERVLDQCTKTLPLLEKCNFLSISASNLDEFFRLKVGRLYEDKEESGEVLQRLTAFAQEQVKQQYDIYQKLWKELAEQQIAIVPYEKLLQKEKRYLSEYFIQQIYPLLTPITLGPSDPFPLIAGQNLYLGAMLHTGKTEPHFTTIQVPPVLGRLVELHGTYVFLEDIIRHHLPQLLDGQTATDVFFYRVTRRADVPILPELETDLPFEVEKCIRTRKIAAPLRLEISQDCPKQALLLLQEQLGLDAPEIYRIPGPLDLTFLSALYASRPEQRLKYPAFQPAASVVHGDLFETLRREDVLLHHPYQSFDTVIQFIRQAAADPQVLAIKQTLYRVSHASPIIDALVYAAGCGKQVTVLLELKARFDEENNLHCARRLEKAGAHVIYGRVDLKTHCKMLLVVREEQGKLQPYAHLSTGNYNEKTAKGYTDLGLLTSEPQICNDLSVLFNCLSAHLPLSHRSSVYVSPLDLRRQLEQMITQEIAFAKQGKTARIMMKMNALCDEKMVNALYRAATAGVKVTLIVRGICTLVPREHIEVVSIVGRFLEHSRIYAFHAGGTPQVYLSSADLMPRNLDRRIELLFPVRQENHIAGLLKLLERYAADNINSYLLQKDGTYRRRQTSKKGIDAQALKGMIP